jgi:methionyl-tRNA formyltransferase
MEKNNQKKYKCIILAGREHGLQTLSELLKISNYEIIAIFTHKFNPKSHNLEKKERDDFCKYKKIALNNDIPIYTIDNPSEKNILEEFSASTDYDFLISISWRYLITPQVFEKAKIGSINLHRGDLPKYAGIEPIKRALGNSEKNIYVTSHHISKNFDEGEVIFKIHHPTNYDISKSLEENIERLKNEITIYFPQLTIKSLKFLIHMKCNGR